MHKDTTDGHMVADTDYKRIIFIISAWLGSVMIDYSCNHVHVLNYPP